MVYSFSRSSDDSPSKLIGRNVLLNVEKINFVRRTILCTILNDWFSVTHVYLLLLWISNVCSLNFRGLKQSSVRIHNGTVLNWHLIQLICLSTDVADNAMSLNLQQTDLRLLKRLL